MTSPNTDTITPSIAAARVRSTLSGRSGPDRSGRRRACSPARRVDAPGADARDSGRDIGSLVVAYRSGDATALAALMAECGRSMAAVARRYVSDPYDVEDAVQEAWIAFTRRADAIETPRAVGGWLCVTTAHAALAIARRRARCCPTGIEFDLRPIDATTDDIDRDVDLDGETAGVREALDRLAQTDREMLQLLFVEELPYASITARTGRAIGGIGPTRARLLTKLRQDQSIRQLAAARLA